MKSILLRIALFGILLVGMSAFSSEGQLKAQASLSPTAGVDLFTLPAGNFVSAPVAQQRLETKIQTLKGLLQGLTEGTPEYRAVWAQYIYYTTILNSVMAGKTIPQSIVDGLTAVSTDVFSLSRVTLLQYRTEAINLLKA
jgi:hypothetical protein